MNTDRTVTKEIHVDRNAVADKLTVAPDGKVVVDDQAIASALKAMSPMDATANPEGIRITINIS